MNKRWRGRFVKAGVVVILALILAAVSFFAAPPKTSVALPAKPVVELSRSVAPPPGTETVDMFAAIDRGDLAVRLIPEKDQ